MNDKPMKLKTNENLTMKLNENEIADAYFNALDLQRTISSNGLNDIQRVHEGTDNEDTMKDLIDDLVSFLTNSINQ